jgi:hypothetical protein
MATIDTRGDGERVDIVLRTDAPAGGGRHVNAIAEVEAEHAISARNSRRWQGIPDPPPPPTEGYIDTRGFASRCGFRRYRANPLDCHTEAVAFVRVGDCPAGVLAILRQSELEEWLNRCSGEDVIDLGPAVQLSTILGDQQVGPRRLCPVADIVARNRDSVTAQEIRAEEDRAAEMALAEARRKEAEELARMHARHAHEAAAAEADRVATNPAYRVARAIEEEKARLEASIQARIDAAVQAALDRATAPQPLEGQEP